MAERALRRYLKDCATLTPSIGYDNILGYQTNIAGNAKSSMGGRWQRGPVTG